MVLLNLATSPVPVLIAAPLVVGAGGVLYVLAARMAGIAEAQRLVARASGVLSRDGD